MGNKFFALSRELMTNQPYRHVFVIEDEHIVQQKNMNPQELKTYIAYLEELGYTRAYFEAEQEASLRKAKQAIEKAQEAYDIVTKAKVLDSRFNGEY